MGKKFDYSKHYRFVGQHRQSLLKVFPFAAYRFPCRLVPASPKLNFSEGDAIWGTEKLKVPYDEEQPDFIDYTVF